MAVGKRHERQEAEAMTTTTASDTTKATAEKSNGNVAAMTAPATKTEMAKASPIATLKKLFDQWKPTLRAVLPRHIDPERVIKIALNVYLNNPELQKCTPISMVRATLQCAELGLEPGPLLQECAFIAYNNNKKVKDGNQWKVVPVLEVQCQPMYVGLIKLAKQTGEISDVYAVVVDESERHPEFNDRGELVAGFHAEQGTERRIRHVQSIDGRTGNLFAVYAVVKFKDGTNHFEIMSKAEVERIRSKSKQATGSTWTDHYDEMAKKTAIKRALKTVPKSPEKPRLAQAIAADNAQESGEAFSTDVAGTIDTDGEDVTGAPSPNVSRTEALAGKLGASDAPFDPETGEVR